MANTCSVDVPLNEVHRLYWLFDRWCERKYGKDYHSKLFGEKVIEDVRKFVSRNKEIKIVKVCDDEMGDKAILVIIPHPSMGKTVIFIPEKCQTQNVFFLYDKRESQLIEILKSMQVFGKKVINNFKKVLLISLLMCSSVLCFSQDTIVTPAGDQYTYYLDGNTWSQFTDAKTKLSVNMFVASNGDKSVWVLNLNLKEVEFKKLINYIDTIPKISVGARTFEEGVLVGFEIYANDNNNIDFMPMNKYNNANIDIIFIQSKIKSFFK